MTLSILATTEIEQFFGWLFYRNGVILKRISYF